MTPNYNHSQTCSPKLREEAADFRRAEESRIKYHTR